MNTANFIYAKPIWPLGKEREMNVTAGLRAVIENGNFKKVILKVATSGIYKCYVNGTFVGFGPARAARGFFRLDSYDITGYLKERSNIVAIEAAGYNVNSFYIQDQPSFVQAEVLGDGEVIAATSCEDSNFQVFVIKERLQKVERYSFQRTFTEVYDLKDGYDNWKKDDTVKPYAEKCCVVDGVEIIKRNVAYPLFKINKPVRIVSRGRLRVFKPERYWETRFINNISDEFKGFNSHEVEVSLSRELDDIIAEDIENNSVKLADNEDIFIDKDSFKIFDFGINYSGFIGALVSCSETTKLYFVFDEVLRNQDIDFKRLGCINGVCWRLEPGTYSIETFEPYTLRYLKIMAAGGSCNIKNVYLKEYSNPCSDDAEFQCDDEGLNRIFEAARETFKQNAVDIYTDCPSRERAGWLCDSFFTSRVEKWLTGGSAIEKNFLENFLMAKKFEFLPEGMLPMCYPADFYDGQFIPNWALWFVAELGEYLERTGDRELVDALKEKVLKLFKYFEGFKNEYGLLESLESWVFVEWSKANELVQDVNYPTNMLYAHAMEIAGKLYDIGTFLEESKRLKETIRQQSFNGEFFVDNAVRKEGILKVTGECTEVCQYYAFFFNTADISKYETLWNTLVKDFGPDRSITGAFPEIYPANAFIGNYLRLELLSRYGEKARLLDEIKGYFTYMVDKTGTLWEHVGDYASCNHGFASHVIHHIYKDAAGIESINRENMTVNVSINPAGLRYCKVKVPMDNGFINLKWCIEDNEIHCSANLPEKYKLNVNNNIPLKIKFHEE